MKNLLLLITAVSAACILGCKLEEPPRPAVPATPAIARSAIQGVLKYRNAFAADSSRVAILPGTAVSLYSEHDLDRPLAVVVSDSLGRFTFDNLDPDSTYRVAAVASVNAGNENLLVFNGAKQVSGADSLLELILLVDEKEQHGFYISTVDRDGALISKAKILIYGSKIIADADSAYNGSNAITSTNTDNFGNALVTGLPVGKVYLKSAIMLNDSLSLSSDTQLMDVASEEIRKIRIVLH